MSGTARGLGRGLGSLIPSRGSATVGEHGRDAASGETGVTYAELPIAAIVANRHQPRTVFDTDDLDELAASIAQVGLLQPVVVRPLADGNFELVMGERRWRAARQAGLSQIAAIVKQTADDDMLRDALLENVHRAQLNPLEEGAAYQQLLDDFGCTHEQLAERLGKSRPHITNTIRLLRLSPAVQRRLAAGVLSAGHARALLTVQDRERQERLATQAVAEGLSVRSLEELVALEEPPAPVGRRRSGPRATPELVEIADRLSDRLDTRCRVEQGRRRGRIVIDFATAEDLSRILDLLERD